MFKGLPKKIRVGPYTVKIELCSTLASSDGLGDWAQYDLLERKISIDKNQPCTGAAAAHVLHEVLHSIWHLGAIENAAVEEERIVETFATWLTSVFKQNPALLRWYAATLKKE